MPEQLIFNFPFKRSYLSQDFYVSENNINAFKLIESWPNWSSRFVNIYGPKGCGKTHLINIIKDKIESVMISASKVDSKILLNYKIKECLIIDGFKNQIEEKLFYTITNMASQDNKYLIVSSLVPLKKFKVKLNLNIPNLDKIYIIFSKTLIIFCFIFTGNKLAINLSKYSRYR